MESSAALQAYPWFNATCEKLPYLYPEPGEWQEDSLWLALGLRDLKKRNVLMHCKPLQGSVPVTATITSYTLPFYIRDSQGKIPSLGKKARICLCSSGGFGGANAHHTGKTPLLTLRVWQDGCQLQIFTGYQAQLKICIPFSMYIFILLVLLVFPFWGLLAITPA